jgi:hypothetical protein
MAKAMSTPSTKLNELKNWVSEDADLDTVTRWYQWEKTKVADSIAAAEESRNSGQAGLRTIHASRLHEIELYQPVQRTFDRHRTRSQDMGVHHRRAHVRMAEQLLNCTDIATTWWRTGLPVNTSSHRVGAAKT